MPTGPFAGVIPPSTSQSAYKALFGAEKDDIGPENTYLFDIKTEQSRTWCGPTPGSIAHRAGMPITWNASMAFITLVLTVAMCVIAGIGASLKALKTDPAELF